MQLQIKSDDHRWHECYRSDYGEDYIIGLTINRNLLNYLMTIEEDFWAELAQIQAESIGWTPLEEVAYHHKGTDD